MMRGLLRSLTLGLALIGKFAGSGWCAQASLSETNQAITIGIDDYANVGRATLMEAKTTAARIFRKAGVESRWTESGPAISRTTGNSVDPGIFILSDIQLRILPGSMAERLGLPDGVLGVAPGAEAGRRLAYVFYNRVASLAQELMWKRVRGDVCESASTTQILGHAMAHEIGHLLLNLETHSDTGIMRANWDVRMLHDACYGYLLFTRQQAESMRAEVERRFIDLEASGRLQKVATPADRVIIARK
jgi:hypothetical protein